VQSSSALGCNVIEPINALGIAATLLNEAALVITTVRPALVAGHAQQIRLTDDAPKYDCAVATHGDDHRMLRNPKNRGGPLAIRLPS
jgi:hypothetical protein